MADDIVIFGAGGFGREVLDVIDAINQSGASSPWNVLGVLDDDPSSQNLDRLARRAVPYLGPLAEVGQIGTRCHFVVGVGSPAVRRKLAEHLSGSGLLPATLVHPSATFGFDVRIGAGSVVCAGVRLTNNIEIGQHVHINLNATVGHDCSIGNFVSINPLASISGDCVLGDEVLVGVGGVVLNGVHVGPGSTIGGSACVVRDVAAGIVVKGVPAR